MYVESAKDQLVDGGTFPFPGAEYAVGAFLNLVFCFLCVSPCNPIMERTSESASWWSLKSVSGWPEAQHPTLDSHGGLLAATETSCIKSWPGRRLLLY